jgi:hypothetical protein
MRSRLAGLPGALFLFLVPAWLCTIAQASERQPEKSSMRLTGTFLQLGTHHNAWTEARWSELFDYFHRLQLSQVILQWTVSDEAVFYDSTGKAESPLNRILPIAARRGIDVWVGLYHDPRYWSRIGAHPEAAALYLRQLRSKSLAIARDLAPLLRQHCNFAGWYLSEEIDDVNWLGPAARQALLNHLKLTSDGLHGLTPAGRVSISTFSNARVSPARFRAFWTDVFRASSIDLVLLQDGVGVNKLELKELPIYAGALATAAGETGRECGVVVELFRQTGGAPLDTGAFKAVPASWERVRRQLGIASQFTSSVFGFSVPEYMSPAGTDGAERLYLDYIREALHNNPN